METQSNLGARFEARIVRTEKLVLISHLHHSCKVYRRSQVQLLHHLQPLAESAQLLVVQHQLSAQVRHLVLHVDHPLQSLMKISAQLLLSLGTPLPEHNQPIRTKSLI